jgi:hypothetical protein
VQIHAVSPAEWSKLAEDAHRILFGESRPAEFNTFDYAMVVVDKEQITAYATIIEMDKETAYMQHGGALPNIKGTINSKRTYHGIIEWLKSRYKRISTRIQNKNVPMIKLALSEDLIIHGCDCHPDGVYLHLGWGFGH